MNAPQCPRCGYDQSGETARWDTECPTTGLCPECGLAFEWTHVFRQDLLPPRWSYEHIPTRSNYLRTLLRNLLLFRFFKRIRLEAPVHRRRLWIYAASVLALFYATLVASGAASSYLMVVQQAELARLWYPTSGKLSFTPWSRRNGIGVPNMPWVPPVTNTTAHVIWAGAMTGRALWPFSDHLARAFVGPEFSPSLQRGFPSPVGYFPFFVAMVTPASMLVLRQTMHRCRIRRDQLLRVWAYALPPIGLLSFLATCLSQASHVVALNYGYSLAMSQTWMDRLDKYGPALPLLPLVWFFLYWLAAVRTYFRLPHAWAVWLLTLILGLLAGIFLFGVYAAVSANITM